MRQNKTATPEAIYNLVPEAPAWRIDWETIWSLFPEFSALDTCPQDPVHHAEGDAGTHTRMVVEALVEMDEWCDLSPRDRSVVFWAACFHDIGKPDTTKHEEYGRITSRGHSRRGAAMTRGLLRNLGVDFFWREEICAIILKHQLPFWLIERPAPERTAIEISLACRADLLCLHAHADARGRICKDQQDTLDNVALARQLFVDMGCLEEAFNFANDESRLGFLEADSRDPFYIAHEDFRCCAYVMSALPGSGKDTWIARNLPDIPMVSLDRVRAEIGIDATQNQGRVIQAAYELARTHLRAKRDFVWNATNITQQTRGKIIRLLRNYNAKIHIIYLEVLPETLLQQNVTRTATVPTDIIEKLTWKLEPPQNTECHVLTNVVSHEINCRQCN